MSHNIRLSGVKFSDLALLGTVVEQVSGGKARLDTTAKTFRTYRGQSNKCDAAIIMPGMYDIGLLRAKDGNHYEPIMESALAYNSVLGDGKGNGLGLVQQEFVLREAEYEAAQRGMTTERVTGERGRISLRMSLPA